MNKHSKSSLSNGVSGASKSASGVDNISLDVAIKASHSVVKSDAASDDTLMPADSGGDAATRIESHLVARVLVLTAPYAGDATANDATTSARTQAVWSATLMRAGHQVSWMERDAWKPDALDPCGDDSPEVMLFETVAAERDFDAVAALCREIKSGGASHCTTLLVALPVRDSIIGAGDNQAPIESAADEAVTKDAAAMVDKAVVDEAIVVARLQEAGADDFLAGQSESELLARVGVMTRLSRVRAELEATREHLRLQMQLDDLTRLLNRRFFFQAAHREYGRARRYNHDLSCLMLDVNGFKQINATLGYECGDAVLRQVAGILRDATRDCDILARWAEDKFVILLPETPLEGAITLRENLAREVASQAFNWHERDLPLSVSIGEAARRLTRSAQAPAAAGLEFGADFEGGETHGDTSLSLREEMAGLLEEADAALYVAKRGVRYQALPGARANQINPASS